MDPAAFPTKGNLMAAKNSLALARQGYGLMDKKRNILIRELKGLIDQAKEVQKEIDKTFGGAYDALRQANIEMGIDYVQDIAQSVPLETGIRVKSRSVMGTEIPLVQYEKSPLQLTYAYYSTRESLDEARGEFSAVRDLTARLAMIENAAYRLARDIKKTQKKGQCFEEHRIAFELLLQHVSPEAAARYVEQRRGRRKRGRDDRQRTLWKLNVNVVFR